MAAEINLKMKKIILSFLIRALFPVILLLYAASNHYHLPLKWPGFIFLTIALWPRAMNALKDIFHRRFDIGISMLLTVYLLVYLNSISIAAAFVLIMIFGDLFKDIILQRVRKSLEKITVYLPHTGFIKIGEEIKEIDIAGIKINDTIAVRPGGRVPADGILISDAALLDESVISGESRPISAAKGVEIPAGSINAGDYFEVRATRVGENSTISQIRKIAEEAGREKAPIARFIDQYAKYTSVVAAFLVIAVYALTGNLFHALGLWIAMVPIIFAIIGPVSASIGISTAAKIGILIKNSETIEDLTKIKHIVFDKTGTLTVGLPSVRDVVLINENNYAAENNFLALAAGMEKKSEHEIARAIIREAEQKNIAINEFSEVHTVKGGGLTAERSGDKFAVGSRKFLENQRVTFNKDFTNIAAERENNGETPVFVSKNGELLGGIFIADMLRPETPKVIQILKNEGYDLHILTGDDRMVANYISELLKLDKSAVAANLSPQDKISRIHEMELKNEHAIMVGDGINDAPALSAAAVGIAMGVRGTDIATNAADVVLVEENLLKIPEVINNAKRIISVIKQDLISATAIHVIAGALAVFGVITLLQTAIFHEVSSIIVLANTARLFFVHNDYLVESNPKTI